MRPDSSTCQMILVPQASQDEQNVNRSDSPHSPELEAKIQASKTATGYFLYLHSDYPRAIFFLDMAVLAGAMLLVII